MKTGAVLVVYFLADTGLFLHFPSFFVFLLFLGLQTLGIKCEGSSQSLCAKVRTTLYHPHANSHICTTV